ncbi:MAG: chorismate-binding protein [Candidatus Amulumruptor caecigallinarius]|nr:chorismate-binding protein [Candidatus Amulumruptor caecigallinarius]
MNCFAYRLPLSDKIVYGASEDIRKGICGEGFVFTSFDNGKIFTIPGSMTPGIMEMNEYIASNKNAGCMPDHIMSREEHTAGVNFIRESIRAGGLEKCVLARAIRCSRNCDDAMDVFMRMHMSYPGAFVFLFSTAESGTWVGASPELLLKRDGYTLHTMALAGTRASGVGGGWDSKNIREHKVVSKYLLNELESAGLQPEAEPMTTAIAGPVEHLVTRISATGDASVMIDADNIALHLSPSPALAGYPKEKALDIIRKIEGDRLFYGGFCGPRHSNGDFQYYVNIRSMCLSSEEGCIFAGGGIMAESDPNMEWEETEKKASTLNL